LNSFFPALMALALLFVVPPARADTRYGLFIGNNLGLSHETPLRWAETDARRIHDVMRELGDLGGDRAVVLLGENASVVRTTLIRLNERIRQDGGSATLIVHYSGHADAKNLHLGETTLPIAEMESLVRGSAASFRLLILDACRSGTLTRVKGGVVVAPVPVRANDLVRSSPAEGVVFLTASARDEDAQESDAIRGSFFTHYLASGLRGAADIDSDGAIDLDEAFRFAAEHTLRATSTSAIGPQHPTFRHEFAARNTVVLTRYGTNQRNGRLVLPEGLTWFVFNSNADGPLLAEVQRDDRARTVSVRGPQVFLRGRAPDALLEATVDVIPGQVVNVARVQFRRLSYARLVRKGGGPDSVHALEAGYRFEGTLNEGGGQMHGAVIGYVHERADFSLFARVGFALGGFTRPGTAGIRSDDGGGSAARSELRTTTHVFEGTLGLRRAFDVGPMSIEIGGAAGLAWVYQSFDWVGEAPDRHALAGRIDGVLGIVVDVSETIFARVDLMAGLWLIEKTVTDGTQLTALFSPRAQLSLGVRL